MAEYSVPEGVCGQDQCADYGGTLFILHMSAHARGGDLCRGGRECQQAKHERDELLHTGLVWLIKHSI